MKRFLQSMMIGAGMLAMASTVTASATDVYIIGSDVNGQSWALGEPDALMTDLGGGIFEWSGESLGSGFKFNDGTWDNDLFEGTNVIANIGSNGERLVPGEPCPLSAGPDFTNILFADDLICIEAPHVVLDLNKMTVVVTGQQSTQTIEWCLTGTFDNWDLSNPDYIFTEQADGTYILEHAAITLPGEGDYGELLVAGSNWMKQYGSPTYAPYPFLLEQKTLYSLEEEGFNIPYNFEGLYTVTFTPGETPTLYFEPEGDIPVEYGTKENPWSVEQLLAKDPAETITGTWMQGYIVGYVDGQVYDSGCHFEISEEAAVSATNILLAATADETDYTKCMPIQLPKGDVRTGLNLADNPGNMHKEVALYGNFEKYFGVNGFKSVSEYEFIPASVNPDDPVNPELDGIYIVGSNVNDKNWELGAPDAVMTLVSDGVYEWSGEILGTGFKFNDGTWDNDNFNIGGNGSDLVLGEEYALANGYDVPNIYFADGIISIVNPHVVLNLNTFTVTVTGENSGEKEEWFLAGSFNNWELGDVNYQFTEMEDGTMILENAKIPAADEIVEFVIGSTNWYHTYGSADGMMISEGEEYPLSETEGMYAIPSDFNGIYNVVFTPGENPTVLFDRVGDIPVEYGTKENPWSVEQLLAKDPAETITGTWMQGYIVGYVDGQVYDSGCHFEISEEAAVSATNILLAATADETDYTKCMPIQLPKGDVRTGLNLADNPGNMHRRVALYGNFEKYFGVNGFKSVSEYSIYPGGPVEPEIDYSKMVFAYKLIEAEQLTGVEMKGGPTEFVVENVKFEGESFFLLADWNLEEAFLSFGSEDGVPATIIDSENLSGTLEYTRVSESTDEGHPNFYGYLNLTGYYNVNVRFEGKTAYLTFEENAEYADRVEAIAAYSGDIYVIGDVNNWDLADENYKMTRIADGVYQWDGIISGAFKFNDGTWDNALIEGTDIVLNIGSADGEPISLNYWFDIVAADNSYNIYMPDSEEHNVQIFLDLNNMKAGLAELEMPDPEVVKVNVTVTDGMRFSYFAKNHEETTFEVAMEDEFWGLGNYTVNGELYEVSVPSQMMTNTWAIDSREATFDIVFEAVYNGELSFVDSTTGVVELENAVKISVVDGKVVVENLTVGQPVVVYNLGGQIIGTYQAREARLEISLNSDQIYVVRAGNAAAKVQL